MGQKINPISLRLQYTNRQFDNCWYSNYFYKNLINKDVLFHSYLNNFLKLMKLPTGRYSIQHLQKKHKFIISSVIQNLPDNGDLNYLDWLRTQNF